MAWVFSLAILKFEGGSSYTRPTSLVTHVGEVWSRRKEDMHKLRTHCLVYHKYAPRMKVLIPWWTCYSPLGSYILMSLFTRWRTPNTHPPFVGDLKYVLRCTNMHMVQIYSHGRHKYTPRVLKLPISSSVVTYTSQNANGWVFGG